MPVFAGIGKLIFQTFGEPGKGLALLMICGMLSLMLCFSGLAFFTGLSLWIEIAGVTVGLAAFFSFRVYLDFYSFLKGNFRLFFPILGLILLAGSYYPFILDHFGYYVPTLKWLADFGLVKGIANLDLTLGQMSFWHVLQAGFSGFSDPFLRLNTILLCIYLIYILEKKSWIHLVFLPVFFLFSQSPSTDLPGLVFSLIILDEIFRGNQNFTALFMFSMWVFVIKPTMLWTPLFVFLWGIFCLKEKWWRFFPGILILILFFIKNLWTFGYPVFPVQFADLQVSWKPNPEILRISSELAVTKTFDMQYTYQEISGFSTWEYVKNWFFLKGIKSGIHFFFIFSLLALLVYTLKKCEKRHALLCIALVLKSILILIFSAQYRFFLDVFFSVFFIIFAAISKKKAFLIFGLGTTAFLIFISNPNVLKQIVPSFKPGQFMLGYQNGQWIEPSRFEWKKYQTYTIGNLRFHAVEKYPFNFDIPLPAISPQYLLEDYEAGIFPQKRGTNLKSGFVWKKMTPEEKKRLKKILDKWQSSSGISQFNEAN